MTPTTKPYKAGVAFALSFIGALVTALTQHDVDNLGWEGWIAVIGTALLTSAGVYQIANPPAEAPPAPTHLPATE
jgi:hypothetical protein